MLASAIGVGDHQPALPRGRIVAPEGEALAIGREIHSAINVGQDQQRGSAQHRGLVEVTDPGPAFVGSAKKEIIAVRRKSWPPNLLAYRRNHFGLAAGG